MRKTACAWTALCLLLAASAGGRAQAAGPREHRSHRWRGADRERKARETAAAAETRRAALRPKRLKPGRWRPEAAEALEDAIERFGSAAEKYSPRDPPVAIFSFDDVAVTGDAGEAVFRRLVTEAEFKFDEAFWELVPVHFGRLKMRAGYEEFHKLPRSIWDKNAFYLMYRKEFFKCHEAICREYGRKECALWRLKLLKGFKESEQRVYARSVIDDELARPLGTVTAGLALEDPDAVRMRAGLRFIPEMRDLFVTLADEGFDVWVLSASSQWAAEEMARDYGVHPSRVVGMRSKVAQGLLTAEPLVPLPEGSGKREAAAMFLGRSPAIIVGGEDDGELLAYGKGVRIRVVERDPSLPGFDVGPEGENAAGGLPYILMQPRFSPVRSPQARLGARGPD